MDVASKERFLAASKLVAQETTTLEKFEETRRLIKGIDPGVDRLLESCSEAISKIEKLKRGEVVDLGVEALPEGTDEEKRRKKAILFFIKNWKDLQAEVERVRAELDSSDRTKSNQEQIISIGKIAAFAKGPFGAITLSAVIIAAFLIYISGQRQNQVQTSPLSISAVSPSPTPLVVSASPSPSVKNKIKVITYNGKKIALSELTVATGSECTYDHQEQVAHYHAKNHTVAKAVDGTDVFDPGGCGFGKVSEVAVEEVEQ